ncbi:FMRFamide neuropeptide [Bacillus sp. K2I17]|nr:FMRFamide neuropeptide [Bacillus sp. K2I17]
MGMVKETTEENRKEIMGMVKETTEEGPKGIMDISKRTMAEGLSKESSYHIIYSGRKIYRILNGGEIPSI